MNFQFPVNTFPETGAFGSAPLSRRPPLAVPDQPHGHAGAVRDAVVSNSYCDILPLTPRTHIPAVFQAPPANADSDYQLYEDREDNHLPPNEHHNHATNNYAGLALGGTAQAQAAPPAPVCLGPIIP